MAYELRYTLTEKLRDGFSMTVKIYEESPTIHTVYEYTPTSIILNPNSNTDEPEAGVVSSELNVSFLISTEEDYNNFPDLLNFNDNKYYVELVYNGETEVVRWKGYLFNDYIEVPFTTGHQEVKFVCVDALSYLKYTTYESFNANTNSLIDLMSVINTCLKQVNFPATTYLYSCVSYFAFGMSNRGDAVTSEPLSQTYQFIRDFVGIDYHTLLDNIVRSFGCKLFQYNGDWWIIPISQIVDDNVYYTKYQIGTSVSLISGGTLSNLIEIKPYVAGDVHFIDNSQTKITKKGYSRLIVNAPFEYAQNYITDGDFKGFTGTNTAPIGFTLTTTGAGFLYTQDNDDEVFNTIRLQSGTTTGGLGTVKLEMQGNNTIPAYLPSMMGFPGTVSFNYGLTNPNSTYGVVAIAYIYIIVYVGSTAYYLNETDNWVTSVSYIQIPQDNPYYNSGTRLFLPDLRATYSRKIPFGKIGMSSTEAQGYCKIGFYIPDDNGINVFFVNNFKLQQNPSDSTAIQIKRELGDNKALVKEIEVPYGSIYKDVTIPSPTGTMYNASKGLLTSWYRYGKDGYFSMLPKLICRQYSNIFNKNIATLEGDIGNYDHSGNLIYLQNKYTIQDSATDALSYNNKKFIANRMTIDPYNNKSTSIQLIEIDNEDNDSFESIKYLSN